jgi:hypothetical protein
MVPDMNSTQQRPSGTFRTGRFNSLGDELVVFYAKSDFGTYGWFTGERYVTTRDGEEHVSLHTKIFFEGTIAAKALAIADLETAYYDDYPKNDYLTPIRDVIDFVQAQVDRCSYETKAGVKRFYPGQKGTAASLGKLVEDAKTALSIAEGK